LPFILPLKTFLCFVRFGCNISKSYLRLLRLERPPRPPGLVEPN
jgi:hypothetical protein